MTESNYVELGRPTQATPYRTNSELLESIANLEERVRQLEEKLRLATDEMRRRR
jgi:hypothetical protein